MKFSAAITLWRSRGTQGWGYSRIAGHAGNRPLHVVYADTPTGERVIITADEPDLAKWSSDFTQRIQS